MNEICGGETDYVFASKTCCIVAVNFSNTWWESRLEVFWGTFKEYRKCVICGIGNPERGDDAFGTIVAARLKKLLQGGSKVVVLNCEGVPEKYTDKIIAEDPSHVIFIDVMDFGGKPGEVAIVDPENTIGSLQSVHRLPLKLLVKYLEAYINPVFWLVGCQPVETELFSDMSDAVWKAMPPVIELILTAVSREAR